MNFTAVFSFTLPGYSSRTNKTIEVLELLLPENKHFHSFIYIVLMNQYSIPQTGTLTVFDQAEVVQNVIYDM